MKTVSVFRGFIAISGAYCVLFSAWLAHGAQTLPVPVIKSLDAALNIQFLHTLTLLSLYVWYNLAPQKSLKISLILFTIGTILFSGSIYIKTLTGFSMLGQLAPLGGVTLALAWLSLLAQRKQS